MTDFHQELWQTSVERLDIKVGKTISLTFKNGVPIDRKQRVCQFGTPFFDVSML